MRAKIEYYMELLRVMFFDFRQPDEYVGYPKGKPPSITCPRCGMTSYHPMDIQHQYCGKCNVYWGEDGA